MLEIKWFERKFDFNLPISYFPYLIERLSGTPARLEEKVNSLQTLTPSPPAGGRDGVGLLLTQKIDDRWSIQENAGHLLDLEILWEGRFEDFMNNVPELRTADLQNRKTHDANHNNNSIDKLLQSFRKNRERTVSKLEGLDQKAIALSALHPRLNKPMRIIDLAFFVAEHDDHHLAQITQLIKALNQNPAER